MAKMGNPHMRRLSKAEVWKILDLLAQPGTSQTEIAKDFGVSKHAVHHIAKGNNWKEEVREYLDEKGFSGSIDEYLNPQNQRNIF